MATRRKKTRKSKQGNGGSAMGWFVAGLVIGMVGAVFMFRGGMIPSAPDQPDTTGNARSSEAELLADDDASQGSDSRFDFFTVLPEMEVVVPEQELADQVEPVQQPTETGGESFILQAGSFRNSADAEQMKARLALLGSVADIQSVTVNSQTWHRVRIGPVSGARNADRIRRQLQDNGIDVLVLKDSS